MSVTSVTWYEVFTPHLARFVALRPNGTDEQVWADTFTGGYHLPPARMPDPKTVLDLGANIGLTSAHYRHLWPDAEVVAVELDEENAALAAINAVGVEVRHEAVSARGGLVSYDSAKGSDAYRLDPSGDRSVRSLPLRKIILRSFGGPVDFVKMDVEGTEWAVFERPDWAPLVDNLLVELHGAADESSERLVADAVGKLHGMGFGAERHAAHPQAVFAWK